MTPARMSKLTLLLAAAAVVAVMIGYNFWRTGKDLTDVGLLKPKCGLVTGITYSEEKPSAVIDSKIVYEGDIIHGVKVVKIDSDKVEFERKGKRWTQRVQEKPNRAWPKKPISIN